jgi:hypothetical protein
MGLVGDLVNRGQAEVGGEDESGVRCGAQGRACRKHVGRRRGYLVKKLVLLVTAALVAMLILVPSAMAQDTLVASGGQTTAEPLPPSGGATPSVLLPAAALLLGAGVLGYAVLRRR